jgi:hypothetical protein
VPTGAPAGGGIWGWAGVAITPDGDVWAASANANGTSVTDDGVQDAESVTELSPELVPIQTSHVPDMPHHGDYGFGSTPVVFRPAGCPALVAAEGKNGELYLWQRATLSKGIVQRIQVAYPATLYGSPAWDGRSQQLFVTTSQGFGRFKPGLQAFSLNRRCTLSHVSTVPLGNLLDSIPTVANDTVAVATGSGRLVVASNQEPKRLVTLRLGGAAFVAPTVIGDDVIVPTWNGRLDVFRLRPKGTG